MRKFAASLAKQYDFETEEDYYNYIIASYQNGQRQQARTLFNQMKKSDQETFLINHLDTTPGQIGKSVLNLCIEELTK